jgi:hypothetical protein
MSSGQLATTRVRPRDCGVPLDDDRVCVFVGDVDVHYDPETVTGWYSCPECGAEHDDGDPREDN